jgi:cytochrome b561
MGPLGRIVASVVAAVVLVGAIVFGFFVLAVLAALGILLWAALSIRGWWLRRNKAPEPASSPENQSETIEAEYTVISRRRD